MICSGTNYRLLKDKSYNNNNKMSKKNSFFKIIIVLSIAISILSLYLIFMLWPEPKKLASNYNINNDTNYSASQSQLAIQGNFALVDTNNQTFDSKLLQGNPYLIYFGFTFCPDVCPATLEKLSEVANILELYHINIPILFVTVDPKRDTVEILKNYMNNFSNKIIALSGTEQQIEQIAKQFKVYYAISPTSNPENDDYLIDHTVFVYLMDKDGNYLTHFGLNQSVEEIVKYIRTNIR